MENDADAIDEDDNGKGDTMMQLAAFAGTSECIAHPSTGTLHLVTDRSDDKIFWQLRS